MANVSSRKLTVIRLSSLSCAVFASFVALTAARGQEPPESEEDDPYADPEPVPTASVERPKAPPVRAKATEREGMIRLPGGEFTVGSSDSRAPSNERPPRKATVAPFWIDKTEVTVAAYRACVDRRFCVAPTQTSASCTYGLGDDELPVSCVRWKEADTFCRASGKRLPSEVEWEFAARGTLPHRYPWGGWGTSCAFAVTLKSEATFRSCGTDRPSRVGQHPTGATPFGVLDLSGNVEEWVADFYAESRTGTAPPAAGASHVLRGGGWLSTPSTSRTTSRSWGSALEAGPNVGFRCAKGV